jgi:hypothetical protein
MDNWLANIVDDVDSLHVDIDNLNDLLVGFYFIRSIDWELGLPTMFYESKGQDEALVPRFSPADC